MRTCIGIVLSRRRVLSPHSCGLTARPAFFWLAPCSPPRLSPLFVGRIPRLRDSPNLGESHTMRAPPGVVATDRWWKIVADRGQETGSSGLPRPGKTVPYPACLWGGKRRVGVLSDDCRLERPTTRPSFGRLPGSADADEACDV